MKTKKLIIIDGYNILNAWEKYKLFLKLSFENARQELIYDMGEYSKLVGIDLLLVFDAYKINFKGSSEIIKGIEVVYTKQNETADQYIEKKLDETTFEMLDFLEKPSIEDAPSRMACLGRYLLSGKIFKYLEETKPGKNGEIQLTDGILAMMKDGEDVLAYNFTGQRYDIGSKLGLLKANIEFGLRNEETKDEIREYLNKLDIERI